MNPELRDKALQIIEHCTGHGPEDACDLLDRLTDYFFAEVKDRLAKEDRERRIKDGVEFKEWMEKYQ